MIKPQVIFEKDISLDNEKQIKKNLNKIYSAIRDINEMNYSVYITPDSINICDGDTHHGNGTLPDETVVVASLAKAYLRLDCGDW